MRLEVIDLHTVDMDLVRGGPVLDAGCRGFRFTEHFARMGCPVVAMDPSPDINPPSLDAKMWCNFFPRALVGPDHPKQSYLRMTGDVEARHLAGAPKEGDPIIECMTIKDVMDECRIAHWDVVKLNVEGCEYGILRAWPGPISTQIVVSYHEHTAQGQGGAEVARIMEHLSKWYRVVQHVNEPRYGCSPNWWDTVLVSKEA